MNSQLRNFARQTLKASFPRLPVAHISMFKRMYSHGNPDADINTVIDMLPDDRLDWAMQQVQQSIEKLTNVPKAKEGLSVDDLEFLRELRDRLKDGLDRQDRSQIEYAQQMIDDWIDELEER